MVLHPLTTSPHMDYANTKRGISNHPESVMFHCCHRRSDGVGEGNTENKGCTRKDNAEKQT